LIVTDILMLCGAFSFLLLFITFVVATHSNNLLHGGGVRLIRRFRNPCL
jgi:hypothetical protein